MKVTVTKLSRIIQGGMGVGVSNYRLARAVAVAGGLGIVSGTAIGHVLARRLELGDEQGTMRHALEHFPIHSLAEHVLRTYYAAQKKSGARFSNIPLFTAEPHADLVALYLAGNFCEVWLAKEGHDHPIGINYLEKVQLPHVLSFYGAMLAEVDCITMGAGVPIQVPGILTKLAAGESVAYRLHVEGATKTHMIEFDPRMIDPYAGERRLKKPLFLPIIASSALAEILVKKSDGDIDGFIVEAPTAGGHNAPPRGQLRIDENNEPVYGEKDVVDLERIKRLGLPFWLAGSYASPEKLREAIALGAHGIQVGTIFALSEESGIAPEWNKVLRRAAYNGTLPIHTDMLASSSGFPFKVARVPGTSSEGPIYLERIRLCDLGFLRTLYEKESCTIGFRCPSEPLALYERKGGKIADTFGRKCLCNALTANIGLGQKRREGYAEPTLFTLGNDMEFIRILCSGPEDSYSVKDGINYLSQGLSQNL